ncbi:MAG: hypothetical protein FWE34_08920 [Defluviitaleaceae bacterium]|nr:hypothetical protein [Defluviitaleaceae bacterium]
MSEKDKAIEILMGVVNDDVHKVYEKHISDNFVHHNPYFKSDKASLLAGMVKSNEHHPNKVVTTKNVITELPFVVILSHVRITDDLEAAITHIFRFENGKVSELWDISQMIPADMVNEKGMF